MTHEIYDKVKKNIEQFITQEIDRRDDPYLSENQERIIEKYIEEICDESNQKMKSCTEKETEAFRKLMGIDNNGDLQTYKQVCKQLNKHNVRPLIFNANRKLMWAIYREILFEDKVKLIQLEYNYQENKGMIIPEDIEVENLKSIIYFEYEKLREMGINNVRDITNYTIPEITSIINNINIHSRRKHNKEKVANELIKTIHILGFLFNGEDGYQDQIDYFDRLRRIINTEISDNSDEDRNIKKELYHRKELVLYYDRLIKEKELLLRSLDEIDKDISKTKEEIIQKENKIKTRKR